MRHLILAFALLCACFLIAPIPTLAEDGKVSPEAARKIKAVSRDAAQKVKPELVKPGLTKEAAKVPPATRKISPVDKKALEAQAPKVEKSR